MRNINKYAKVYFMLNLLDTHQHLIYKENFSYGWTKDIHQLANDNFTINDYNNITNNLGIGGTLFMESAVDDLVYQDETRFIKSLNLSNNKILGIIASIRPESNDGFDAWLDETIQMDVVGYRRILHVMPNEISETDIFRNNINKIGDAGKTFDMCFLPDQLKVAIKLAQSCDKTRLILNHCGVPNIAGNEMEPWKQNIKELAKIQNVTCKLSGLMAYCAPGTSSLETIRPYVDHVLECFGPARILWGSDWPVVNLGKGLSEWITITREILAKLSDDEAILIAHKTAENIYKVELQKN